MENLYVFNCSVIGALHIENGFPCEDGSACWQSEDGRYSIAVTSDGHGDPACFRSDQGSKAAAEATVDCLKDFAEMVLETEETEENFYRQIFTSQRYRQITIRHLTDTILAEWSNRILKHFEENPFNEEESKKFGSAPQEIDNIAHVYGATLIAGLWLPKALVLLQQGDGRCEVIFSDGHPEQPIPWDPRCADTATTSLCDDDAAASFRSTVLNLSHAQVAACFMLSDGVEDSYRDTYEGISGQHSLMGGVHTFCKHLICKLNQNSTEDFEKYLADLLPGFSAHGLYSYAGSGDDVSVSGIVDRAAVSGFTDKYERDIEQYRLEEELFQKESALNGKKRKHEILRKRRNDARDEYEKWIASENKFKADYQNAAIQCQKIELELEQVRKEADAYKQNSSQVMPFLSQENPSEFPPGTDTGLVSFLDSLMAMGNVVGSMVDAITNGMDAQQQREKKLQKKLIAAKQMKADAESNLRKFSDKADQLRQEYDEAEKQFNEYDVQFQELDRMKADINETIQKLKTPQNTNSSQSFTAPADDIELQENLIQPAEVMPSEKETTKTADSDWDDDDDF